MQTYNKFLNQRKKTKKIETNFVELKFYSTFALATVRYCEVFAKRLKGNQVRILNSPAAVSSNIFE